MVDCCCLLVNVASLREQILPLSTIVAWAAAKNQKGSRGQAGNQSERRSRKSSTQDCPEIVCPDVTIFGEWVWGCRH